MSKVAVLSHLETWWESREPELRGRGMSASLAHSPETADKASVWIDIEATRSVGQAILWETGEMDLRAGERGRDDLTLNEHFDVKTREEVADALERLIAALD